MKFNDSRLNIKSILVKGTKELAGYLVTDQIDLVLNAPPPFQLTRRAQTRVTSYMTTKGAQILDINPTQHKTTIASTIVYNTHFYSFLIASF